MSLVHVTRHPVAIARITRRVPLMYREGADAGTDRPAHVRAASALTWVGERLVVLQDDANFLALADPLDARADAVTLPAGPAGRRQFDDGRGNKAEKLDLESCITVGSGADAIVVAFGSGSTAARERVLVARGLTNATPSIDLIAVPRFYAALRDARDFAGVELNIEGAVLVGDRQLRLFGRGNGAARDGLAALNATCTVDWRELWNHLQDPTSDPPRPRSTARYDLGSIDGVPLGFTDAMQWAGGVMFSAAAEASPDAVRDGEVAGSVIGLIPLDGPPTWLPVLDERGDRFRGKIEGLAPAGEPAVVHAVADADDPGTPSELCVIRIEGWEPAPR